jgi:hypothetical protein
MENTNSVAAPEAAKMSIGRVEVAPQPAPAPLPILPDPVQQLNDYDRALQSLAAEEKRLRDELAVKDPLESTEDTLEFATELLMIVRAISKIKQERGATIRRLASGFGG